MRRSPFTRYSVGLGLLLVDLDVAATDHGAADIAVITAPPTLLSYTPVSALSLSQILIRNVSPTVAVINRSQHEPVVPGPVDSAGTFVFGFVPAGDHEPVITIRVEVQVAGLELELGVPIGHIGTLLVLGYEPEVGLTGQCRIGHIGASG
jgi:hypothetical protein